MPAEPSMRTISFKLTSDDFDALETWGAEDDRDAHFKAKNLVGRALKERAKKQRADAKPVDITPVPTTGNGAHD